MAHWEALKAANRSRTHHMAVEGAVGVELVAPPLDRAKVIALAKAVDALPDGPKKVAAQRRVLSLAEKTPAPERTPERRALAAQGKAMPGGRYPVPDRIYLAKAIRAVGRARSGGKATPEARAKVRRYIIGRAKALGASDMIPKGWKPDGNLSMAARIARR